MLHNYFFMKLAPFRNYYYLCMQKFTDYDMHYEKNTLRNKLFGNHHIKHSRKTVVQGEDIHHGEWTPRKHCVEIGADER